MKCYLTCPNAAHLVKIEFDRSAADGRIIAVRGCSAFDEEQLVECDELCVKLLNEKVDSMIARQRDTEARRSRETDPPD